MGCTDTCRELSQPSLSDCCEETKEESLKDGFDEARYRYGAVFIHYTTL
jgi:hypothetical protein